MIPTSPFPMAETDHRGGGHCALDTGSVFPQRSIERYRAFYQQGVMYGDTIRILVLGVVLPAVGI